MPATTADSRTLTLSSEELAVLAEVAGAEPLLSWNANELDATAVSVVLRGLQARGLLLRDMQEGEVGVSVTPELRPLLAVLFLAAWATTVTIGRSATSETKTFLRSGEVAVVHEEFADGLHRFTAATEQDVAAAIVGTVPEGPEGPPEAVEAVVPIDDYIRAMQLLAEGEVAAAAGLLRGADGYVEVLSTDPETVVVADLGRDADGLVHERSCSFLISDAGFWFVTFRESSVALVRLGAGALRRRLAEFTE